MTLRITLRVSFLTLVAVALAAAGEAAPSPLTISGDLRLRYERDWDSHTSSGGMRTDRDRARARTRLSLGYRLSGEWSLGARVRSGDRDSQQSPHLTFHSSDDATDDFDASLDRYFIQYKSGATTAWAGRNTSPFWQQNEMFWDEDVTPTGVAAIHEKKLETGSLTAAFGGFLLPDGMRELNGRLLAGQLLYSVPASGGNLTVAAGLHSFDGENGAKNLRNRNGVRGYTIGIVSAQWSWSPADGAPLTLGIDFIENFKDYTATEAMPFAATHAGETSGHVFSVVYGQLKNPRDWQLGYCYAHIETFAVNASYAQDDWGRSGSATQSDLSDIEGHEFRTTVVLTRKLNLQAKLFVVDAIKGVQDGQRFRTDLNWRF